MDIQRFHQDLKAAVMAGVPIEIQDSWSFWGNQLNVKQVENLQSTVESETSHRYRAALRTFDQTDTMVPVLEGLCVRKVAYQVVTRTLRWAFIYLLSILALAALGLLFYSFRVVPTIHDLREDIAVNSAVATNQFDILSWIYPMIILLAILLGLTLAWMLVGGIARLSFLVGGHHYVKCKTAERALQNMKLLVSCGMKMDQAVEVSCDLTAADPQVRSQLEAVVNGKDHEQLEELAEYFSVTANQRLGYMKVATPVLLISIVGGLVTVAYCSMIYWPVIELLGDLIKTGAA